MVSVGTSNAEEDELRARYEATLDREREILRVGQMFLVGAQLSSEDGRGVASPELIALVKERRELDTMKLRRPSDSIQREVRLRRHVGI